MHGPRKKAVEFGGSPDDVTLGFRVRLGLGLGGGTALIRMGGYVLLGVC